MDTQPEVVLSEVITIRPPLLMPGGGVDTAAVGPTAITVVDPKRFAYLLYIKGTCVLSDVGPGDIILEDDIGTDLVKFTMPFTGGSLAVGAEICMPFPQPWKTTAKNAAFFIRHSAATIGTWRWNVNGFYSSV